MTGKIKPFMSAGLIAVAAVAVLALYGSDEWLAPLTPLLIGAVVVPLSVLGALFMHPEERGAPSRFKSFGVAFAVAAAIGMGVPALWSVPTVRAQLLQQAGTSVDTYGALSDPSTEVQIEACDQLLQTDSDLTDLADALVGQPELAVPCLQKSQGQLVGVVTTSLASRWHNALVAADSPVAASACVYAEAIARVPLDKGSQQTHLLDCALGAAESDTRMCCVDSLMEVGGSCEEIVDGVNLRELIASGAASTLLALSHQEKTVARELPRVAKRLDLSCKSMQEVAVQLACVSLDDDYAPEGSDSVLTWLFEENADCLSQRDRQTPVELDEMCRALSSRARRGHSLDKETICQTQREVIAERREMLEQLEGLNSKESAALARQISAGKARADSDRMTPDAFVSAMQNNPEAAMKSYSESEMRALMGGMRERAMDYDEALSTSLNSMDDARDRYSELRETPEVQDKWLDTLEANDLGDSTDVSDQTDGVHEQIGDTADRLKKEREKAERKEKKRKSQADEE